MSGIVANIKRCKKCKNIYDANIGLSMIRCPYCFQKQLLMLSWAVMISLCHAVMSLPGDLSRIVSFDGADIRPIKGKT